MNKLIAIVDDEPDIVELVSVNLKRAMFKVEGCSDAESFYRFLDEQTPDLIILDLMLPDADGLEICKYLKKQDKLFFYSNNYAYGKGGRDGQNPGIGIWCR
jgi:DNA-binding response OmpR family regulator